MNNLEWLWEHDRERILRNLTMEDDPCRICPKYDADNLWCNIYGRCTDIMREWLLAEHVDANDDFTPKSVVTAKTMDANDANAAQDMDISVSVQKCPNELPEGDVPSEFAEILMRLAADCSCMGDGIVRHFEPKDVQNDVDALMRVVERDYVSRETYNKAAEIWQAACDEWRKRATEAEAERDELEMRVNSLVAELGDAEGTSIILERQRDEWKAKCETREFAYKQADAERKRYSAQIDELFAERDEWMAKAEEEKSNADGHWANANNWASKLNELEAERNYWKQEVALCMQSAYPPSHSPERAYDPDVMEYPGRHGCTTPSTLVSAVIDGLRDEKAPEYMGLLDEIVKLKDEREGLQDLLRALEKELKIARGDLNLTLNNWEQAKGKIRRQTEELAERKRKLDERDQKTVEEIRDDRADYWKSRAEKAEEEREEWRSKCGKLMGLANEMMSA